MVVNSMKKIMEIPREFEEGEVKRKLYNKIISLKNN